MVFMILYEYLSNYVYDVVYQRYIAPYKQLDAKTLEIEQELDAYIDDLSNLKVEDKVFSEDTDGSETDEVPEFIDNIDKPTYFLKSMTPMTSSESLIDDVLTTTIHKRGIVPAVGDIITFQYIPGSDDTESEIDDLDFDSESDSDYNMKNEVIPMNAPDFHRRPSRSISTYGMTPISPTAVRLNRRKCALEPQKYVVSHIDSIIPNFKPGSTINLNSKFGKTKDIHLHLCPMIYNEMNDDEDTILTDMDRIFWYINLSKMTVCQYEDGYPIGDLDNIKIVKTSTDSHLSGGIEPPVERTISDKQIHKITGNITNFINYGSGIGYGPEYNFNDVD